MNQDKPLAQHSLGVFKPVGHVVMSFANVDDAHAAARALRAAGLDHEDTGSDPGLRPPQERRIRHLGDREMLAQAEADIARASPAASIGQDLNLVKAHRALAMLGYHFLVVRADDDEQATRIAAIGQAQGAERAQHYGHFIVEELIEHASDTRQVVESPDRGLDASTPSGLEGERAHLRPGGKRAT